MSGTKVKLTVHQRLEIDLPGLQVGPWRTPTTGAQGEPRPAAACRQRFAFYIAIAESLGTAVISSTMVPSCSQDQPACALPDRLFELTAMVTS